MIILVLISTIYFIWKRQYFSQTKNVFLTLISILLIQIFFLIIGILSEAGVYDTNSTFPIIDRLQFTMTTIYLVWILNPFKKSLNRPLIFLSSISLIFGFAVVSGIFWKLSAYNRFNYTWFDISWELINILIVLISMVSLIRNHSKSWKLGYLLFILLFIGLSSHFMIVSQNNSYSGTLRLSQLLVFSFIPILYRNYFDSFNIDLTVTPQQLETEFVDVPEIIDNETFVSEIPKILHWLEFAVQDTQGDIIPKFTRALASSLKQGIVLHSNIPEQSNQLTIISGYDSSKNKLIIPTTFTLDENNPFKVSFLNNDPFLISNDINQTNSELSFLDSIVNCDIFENVITVPIQNQGIKFGSLIIISSVNNEIWQFDDRHFLYDLSRLLGKILLLNKTEKEKNTPIHSTENYKKINSTNSDFSHPQKENEGFNINSPQKQSDSIQQSFLLSHSDREEITSVVQDLRQPFSSILGYTDLIMSESAGVINALQRKFLERIKESNEKMRNLLDDLIQVTSFDKKQFNITYQPVNFEEIIDTAIFKNQELLLKKNISLRLDVQQNIPELSLDKDAMQQVLFTLINNASTASLDGGEIILTMCIKENEFDERYLLTTVEDTGGGISDDQIEKVFSKRFVSKSDSIPGLGETGIGLIMTKTLVEAHGGRIWIDVIKDHGNQFTILLPIYN
jgi:signal transduction histidine kinase